MKRLTIRIDGSVYCPGCYHGQNCNVKRCEYCEINDEIREKLADYEDTGMTPEQVIEMQTDWVAMKAASETYRKEKAERPEMYGDGYDPDGNLIYDTWDCPRCGTCSVIWGDDEEGYEHVSVSPKKKFNTPTWNDMCVLKDMFFKDDEEVYQIHPKKSEYVNVMENCLHLWKPIGHELNELVEMKNRREAQMNSSYEKVAGR